MKSKIKQFLFFFLFLIINCNIFSQEFSYLENRIIDKSVDSIIKKYNSYAGLTETGTYVYDPYIPKFKDLFVENASIFNDIEIGKKISDSTTTVDNYIDYLLNYYKEGLIIELTNIKKGKITQLDRNNYIKTVTVNKRILGNHISKGYYTRDYKLIFNISFTKQGDTYRKFKISGINSAIPRPPEAIDNSIVYGKQIPPLKAGGLKIKWYSDVLLTELINEGNDFFPRETKVGTYTYYVTQTNKNGESDPSKVKLTITAKPPNYIFIGLNFTITSTKIHTNILSGNNNTFTNLVEERGTSFIIGGEVNYFFGGNIGIGTGLEITSYKTVLNLCNYESTFDTTDIDSEKYDRLIYGSDIKESLVLTYLT